VLEGVKADVFIAARLSLRARAGLVSGAHAGGAHSALSALSVPGEHGRHERDAGQGQGHPHQKWWTLVAVCLGTFMLLLDKRGTAVNVSRFAAN
jgi:hypothetical protein